ncbi:allantoate amidohydrolase [Kaistia dalseonensis]|uniref:Hydantoinase/carbamoylase family amidase n=1 Tax=Kaistia dalseonensis TaxID=410840 RepID=A0ABU0H448_9HYPH|nr:allantoate amidohydrolase [Kaistia dalseonensis]MCX5493979.1 allantoate amidohydrolase [Kaistia dalseonensis]MDQ0436555.1 hydantoinase/carbamoylase family amidase [Kaistia dalseonensis]
MTSELTTRALGEKAQRMIDALAAISASPENLTRLYLTPEHKRAAELVEVWMREAGLSTRMDAAGTMRGSLPPGKAGRSGNKALLIGSHIDTVIDAGRYDGNLGVVVGILAVETLKARGVELPFGLDILAFGDEEGVRFPVTLTSSAVVAGVFDQKALDVADEQEITLRDALVAFGGDPKRLRDEAYQRPSVLGYLEVHIEQGPVLERANEPLGAVTAIASQSRHRIRIRGEAGHAGTVPMGMRHDALTAAAEIILAAEEIARKDKKNSLVATVGHVEVMPGASNVIPADVRFSLDVRAANDKARKEAVEAITLVARKIDKRRHVVVGVETMLEKSVAECAPRLQKAIGTAVTAIQGKPARSLMSGAGHDGQSMVHLGEFGMIFVRCRAGISHNPNEFVTIDDMGLAVEALVGTILELAKQETAGR